MQVLRLARQAVCGFLQVARHFLQDARHALVASGRRAFYRAAPKIATVCGALGSSLQSNCKDKDPFMRDWHLISTISLGIGAAVISIVRRAERGPGSRGSAPTASLKTPWGEPDLQGIWTDEFDTPFQRPAKYANQEFFTEAQRAELDKERTALNRRATDRELAGAYNLAVFLSTKHTGPRTSRIVDPPNGRIPPLAPAAQAAAAADRAYRLALLRATDTCKNKLVQCRGGTTIPCPRRAVPSRHRATSP